MIEIINALNREAVIRKLPINLFGVQSSETPGTIRLECKVCKQSLNFQQINEGWRWEPSNVRHNHTGVLLKEYLSTRDKRPAIEEFVNTERAVGKQFLKSIVAGFDYSTTNSFEGSFPFMLVLVSQAMKTVYSLNNHDLYYRTFDSFVTSPSHLKLGLFWVFNQK